MSWFGGGLSKLQSFTREVINEVVESVQGNSGPRFLSERHLVTRHHVENLPDQLNTISWFYIW